MQTTTSIERARRSTALTGLTSMCVIGAFGCNRDASATTGSSQGGLFETAKAPLVAVSRRRPAATHARAETATDAASDSSADVDTRATAHQMAAEDMTGARDDADDATPVATKKDLAAHCAALAPEDPSVEDVEGGLLAFEACRAAVAQQPNDGDTWYRLGLSSLQADRDADAVEGFRKASALGQWSAWSYLGDTAWRHDEDAAGAEQLYRRGRTCGDARAARAVLAEDVRDLSLFALHRGALSARHRHAQPLPLPHRQLRDRLL